MKGLDLMKMMRFAVALVAGALLTSGCTEKPKVLRLYTWLDYISPEVVAAFEKKYDCTVEISIFDNNEEMISKLRTDGCDGYDVIVPSTYVVRQMAKERMIVPIDHSRCPNVRKNFKKGYVKVVPEDPELKYAVPYSISPTGFLYATNRIPRGVDINSWAVLGNPAFKGRISLLDDMREVIGAGLMYLGYSLNSTNEQEITAAVAQVEKWLPNVHHWDSEDYKFEVPTGRIWIGQGFGQVARQVILGDDETPPRRDLAFAYPKEGFNYSCEELVLSAGCRNDDLAYAFLDFLYSDPEIGRTNMQYVYGVLPSEPAIAALDPEFRRCIEAEAEVLPRAQVLRGFDDRPDIQALYERLWEKIIRER